MIKDPQIFILYEPGLFGTMVCNVFAEHPSFNQTVKETFETNDPRLLNAHSSGYKNILENFHWYHDFQKIENTEQFFKPLENKGLGIHKISNWVWLTEDFKKHFENFVIGVLVPDISEIDIWAERWFEAQAEGGKLGYTDDPSLLVTHEEWWWDNVKKDMSKVPYEFKRGMSIKEKAKWVRSHYKYHAQNKQPDRTVQINPKYFFDSNKFQNFCDQCCEKINIPTFKISYNKIESFLDKNRKKYNFDRILKNE